MGINSRLSVLFLLIFTQVNSFSFSQNIVPNGDFEDKKGRKTTSRPWRFVNTVDYFTNNGRSPSPMFKDWELPGAFSGESYVGIRVYTQYREFLQVRLPITLEAGKRYYFEMWVHPSKQFNSYLKSIGASFYHKRPAYTSDYYIFMNPPQIQFYDSKGIRPALADSNGWIKISGSFRSNGTERYLSIGNFSKKRIKDRLKKKKWYSPDYFQLIGYVFIDNIQLYELIENSIKEEVISLEQHIDSTLQLPDTLPYTLIEENYIYKLDQEQRVTLEKIRFEFGSDKLLPNSYDDLELVLEYLNDNTEAKIEIIGHTDDVGNAADNQKLSERRAKAVYSHFLKNEIDKERLRYVGKGDTEPIESNHTPQGRAKNRRVEILLKK